MSILGAFEYCILKTIIELVKPNAGRVRTFLLDKKIKCSVSSSYTTVCRLKEKKCLTSFKVHDEKLNKNINHYKITRKGKAACTKFEKQIKEFI